MRIRTMLHGLMTLVVVAAVGCGGGRLAYNTPPAQQLMHPGPGVGGPGPGVIPVGNQMMNGAPTGPPYYIGPGGNRAGCQGGCEGGSCDANGMGMAAGLAMDDTSFTSGGPSEGGDIQQVQYQQTGCFGGRCHGGGGGGYAVGPGMPMMPATSQVAFVGEEGLQISWSVSSGVAFDSAPVVVPARQDFPQGAIYRLKLFNIPGRAAVSLYPTLEVAPVTPRTDAYLAHAPIPVQFTEEDFDQVLSGNFVTKVIYLPDPEFQELALAGVETLVSTRLDPGCDPVAEADKRGSILAIVRIGNKDLEGTSRQFEGGVLPAQYQGEPNAWNGPTPADGEIVYEGGQPGPPQGAYMQGQGGPMPMGAPTAGFAPTPVPPHMIAGAPQYGMPITGTPIGLPGPPHLPLGSPAGLQRHVMKNRTRISLPPPTPQVTVNVKQRPGLNYPAPVNNIRIDEVNRAQANLFHGSLPGPLQSLLQKAKAKQADDCDECQ